jgi:hypothetical protein
MKEPILSENLCLAYKGDRNYVYGPDIFNSVFSVIQKNFNISQVSNIDFSVHQMIYSGLSFQLYKGEKPNENDGQALIKFTVEHNNYYGIIKENGKSIIERTEYLEDEIFKYSQLNENDNCISLKNKSFEYPVLDLLTSLNKRLLTVTRPDIIGKWIFVRVQTSINPNMLREEGLKISLEKMFSTKYTKSAFWINRKKIGYLYFSII